MARDDDWTETLRRARTYRVEANASTNGASPPEEEPYYVDACDVVPEKIEWLWHSRLALGKMSMLDGDPGLGKSTVALDLAARVTTGVPFPLSDVRREAASVIILSAEDGVADTIVPRLEVAGANQRISRIILSDRDERGVNQPVTIPGSLPMIEEQIRLTGAQLLIIDPLMSFFESETSANNDQHVRAALKPLAQMLERTRCAALMLRHLNKSEGKNAVYRGGGSIGIIGAARFGSLVTKNPDNETERILAPTKSNLSIEPPPLAYTLQGVPGYDVARVVWSSEPARWSTSDLMAAQHKGLDPEEQEELDDVAAFTREYLEQNGPSRFEDLWKEARAVFGWGDQKTRQGYKRLGIKPRKEHGKDGQWLLWLPEHLAQSKRIYARDLPT